MGEVKNGDQQAHFAKKIKNMWSRKGSFQNVHFYFKSCEYSGATDF